MYHTPLDGKTGKDISHLRVRNILHKSRITHNAQTSSVEFFIVSYPGYYYFFDCRSEIILFSISAGVMS